MIALPKTASNHHITHQSFSVREQEVQRGTFPRWLTHQLRQEVICHTLQEPPGLGVMAMAEEGTRLLFVPKHTAMRLRRDRKDGKEAGTEERGKQHSGYCCKKLSSSETMMDQLVMEVLPLCHCQPGWRELPDAAVLAQVQAQIWELMHRLEAGELFLRDHQQLLLLCTQRLEEGYLRKKKTLQLPQTSSRLLSGAEQAGNGKFIES
ncbi:hypothetical protein QYF61_011675 [Mycteria americana]|uniref:Uncharacterized protein n=1 Tax=Mycteria americana TaxID=33587 RepID=A0AAN7S736_MYCAM|nr:hypothetical protein QYF61_011675 [Mycteria americana]